MARTRPSRCGRRRSVCARLVRVRRRRCRGQSHRTNAAAVFPQSSIGCRVRRVSGWRRRRARQGTRMRRPRRLRRVHVRRELLARIRVAASNRFAIGHGGRAAGRAAAMARAGAAARTGAIRAVVRTRGTRRSRARRGCARSAAAGSARCAAVPHAGDPKSVLAGVVARQPAAHGRRSAACRRWRRDRWRPVAVRSRRVVAWAIARCACCDALGRGQWRRGLVVAALAIAARAQRVATRTARRAGSTARNGCHRCANGWRCRIAQALRVRGLRRRPNAAAAIGR